MLPNVRLTSAPYHGRTDRSGYPDKYPKDPLHEVDKIFNSE